MEKPEHVNNYVEGGLRRNLISTQSKVNEIKQSVGFRNIGAGTLLGGKHENDISIATLNHIHRINFSR